MTLRRLRCRLAFWLGLLALVVSGLAQNDLSTNVLNAALTSSDSPGSSHGHNHAAGGHLRPDGTWMAGDMGVAAHGHEHTDPAKNGGHSHRGHADCVLCGPLAAMASFTQAPPVLLVLPEARVISVYRSAERAFVFIQPRAAYASRAPPRQQA